MTHRDTPAAHPDPRVATALHTWGYYDFARYEYQVAIHLFPDFDSLATFYRSVLPHELHSSFHLVRESSVTGTMYTVWDILAKLCIFRVGKDELELVTECVRMVGWNAAAYSLMKPENLAYYRGLDVRNRMYAKATIQAVNLLIRSKVPIDYAREALEGKHEVRLSRDAGIAVALFRKGVSASEIEDYKQLLSGYNRWPVNKAFELLEAGVPPEYAEAGAEHRVPLALILDCHRGQVPVEYMVELAAYKA